MSSEDITVSGRVVLDTGGIDIEGITSSSLVKGWLKEKVGGEQEIEYGETHQGFGSIGVQVTSHDAFLRLPKVNGQSGIRAEEVLNSIQIAMHPRQIGLAVLSETGNQIELTEVGDGELEIESVKVVIQLLSLMPSGKELIDVISEEISSKEVEVAQIYSEIGEGIGLIHSQERLGDDSWRDLATRHIVEGHERFDDVIEVVKSFDDKSWVNFGQIGRIREKMLLVAEKQVECNVPLVRSHGDLWEANVRILDEEGKVEFFDQALGYAPAGLDVGFMMGKQLINYLVNRDEFSLKAMKSFFKGYEDEGNLGEALNEVTNPLVFKLVVGASFDGYPNEVRAELVNLAEKLLDSKIENPDKDFDLILINDLWEQIGDKRSEIVKTCFPDDGSLRQVANGEAIAINAFEESFSGEGQYSDLQGYLIGLVSEEGKWDFSLPETDLYSMPLDELDGFMAKSLYGVYEVANSLLSLRNGELGFNSHDLGHAYRVKNRGEQILRICGVSEEQIRLFKIAAWLHDVGNFFSRKSHNELSVAMAAKIFPKLLDDPEKFDVVRKAILFHDIDVVGTELEELSSKNGGDVDQYLNGVREKFGVETLALIIADKADVGSERLGPMAVKSREVVADDPFAFINLFGQTMEIGWDAEGRFQWSIDFTPAPRGEWEKIVLHALMVSSSKGKDKDKWVVPEDVKFSYREMGISQSAQWFHLFWRKYFSRIQTMTVAVFALKPDTNFFNLKMRDQDAFIGSRSGGKIDESIYKADLINIFNRDTGHLAGKYLGKND